MTIMTSHGLFTVSANDASLENVLGVMAVDFTVNYFYYLMQLSFPECAESLCINYWECFRSVLAMRFRSVLKILPVSHHNTYVPLTIINTCYA